MKTYQKMIKIGLQKKYKKKVAKLYVSLSLSIYILIHVLYISYKSLLIPFSTVRNGKRGRPVSINTRAFRCSWPLARDWSVYIYMSDEIYLV